MQKKVYWITGLAGSGKTTIGRALYDRMRESDPAVVFLDGDEMRAAFADDLGYSTEDRKRCAMRYARLCRLLVSQGLTVICCTISMFDEVRSWNRDHIPGYVEVFVKVSMQTLVARDQKGMYTAYHAGKQQELMGMDLTVEFPKHPNIVIENENTMSAGQALKQILNY